MDNELAVNNIASALDLLIDLTRSLEELQHNLRKPVLPDSVDFWLSSTHNWLEMIDFRVNKALAIKLVNERETICRPEDVEFVEDNWEVKRLISELLGQPKRDENVAHDEDVARFLKLTDGQEQ